MKEREINLLDLKSNTRPTHKDILEAIEIARSGLPISVRDKLSELDYAQKMLDNAVFFTNKDGLLALYANDKWGRKAFVTLVAVNPVARRQGVGRKLLQAAISYLRLQGFSTVSLEVISSNFGAFALYEEFGFIPVNKETDIITMEAKL